MRYWLCVAVVLLLALKSELTLRAEQPGNIGASGGAGSSQSVEVPMPSGADFKHEPSGMIFPAKAADYMRDHADKSDAAGLVVVYHGGAEFPDIVAVSIYPLASRTSFDQDVKDVNAEIVRVDPNATQISNDERKVKQGSRELTAKESAFEYSRTRAGRKLELRRRVIMLSVGKHIVKCDLTYRTSEAAKVEKRIEAFLGALTLPE